MVESSEEWLNFIWLSTYSFKRNLQYKPLAIFQRAPPPPLPVVYRSKAQTKEWIHWPETTRGARRIRSGKHRTTNQPTKAPVSTSCPLLSLPRWCNCFVKTATNPFIIKRKTLFAIMKNLYFSHDDGPFSSQDDVRLLHRVFHQPATMHGPPNPSYIYRRKRAASWIMRNY